MRGIARAFCLGQISVHICLSVRGKRCQCHIVTSPDDFCFAQSHQMPLEGLDNTIQPLADLFHFKRYCMRFSVQHTAADTLDVPLNVCKHPDDDGTLAFTCPAFVLLNLVLVISTEFNRNWGMHNTHSLCVRIYVCMLVCVLVCVCVWMYAPHEPIIKVQKFCFLHVFYRLAGDALRSICVNPEPGSIFGHLKEEFAVCVMKEVFAVCVL
jgi:hypothetical protein